MEAAQPSLGAQSGLLNSRQNRAVDFFCQRTPNLPKGEGRQHPSINWWQARPGPCSAPREMCLAGAIRSQRPAAPPLGIRATLAQQARPNNDKGAQFESTMLVVATGLCLPRCLECLHQATGRSAPGCPTFIFLSLQASPRAAGNCSQKNEREERAGAG